MKVIESSYYGDNTRWFIGKAKTTINDPKNLGRIRVRIFGIHTDNTDDISDSDLPWANTVLSTNVFNGSSYQAYGINDGDTVFGIFLDGKHSQSPLVLGVIPNAAEHVTAVIDESDITNGIGNEYKVNPDGSRRTDIISNSNMGSYMATGESIKDVPPATGPANSGGGVKIPEETKQKYCEIGFKFFVTALKERGSSYPHEQAAGLIGNFLAESGMNPTIKAAGTENSWGLGQWNGSKNAGNRLGKLKNFSSQHGLQWNTLDAQLKYTIYELENISIGSRAGSITMDSFIEQSSVSDATRHILDRYENPQYVADYYKSNPRTQSAINNYNKEFNKRLSFAQNIYNTFTKG